MNKIKFTSLILITLVSLISTNSKVSYARNTMFEVVESESKVGFMVKHKITKDVYGGFRNVEGNVTYDIDKNSIVDVNAKIDVSSIDTGNSKRDRHLRSPDFFDAKNFQYITFESSTIKKLGNEKYEVSGSLTMRGLTKNIILYGERKTSSGDDFIFSATSIINRQDFGISWNRPFQKIAGMMVSDEVKILLDIKIKEV
jgi:polyisoprenoid-binding protein YceI